MEACKKEYPGLGFRDHPAKHCHCAGEMLWVATKPTRRHPSPQDSRKNGMQKMPLRKTEP